MWEKVPWLCSVFTSLWCLWLEQDARIFKTLFLLLHLFWERNFFYHLYVLLLIVSLRSFLCESPKGIESFLNELFGDFCLRRISSLFV